MLDQRDQDILAFIYNRLRDVYNEPANIDFMLAAKRAIDKVSARGDKPKYWFAARESRTNKSRTLKILTRPMKTEREALDWAEFEKSLAKRVNSNHTYKAIFMEELTEC